MTTSFGPWATAMSAGRSPQLSSFWRERLLRLPDLSPHVRSSRIAIGAALAIALAVLAMPLIGFAPSAAGENEEAPKGPLALRTRPDRAKDGGNAASEAAVERGLAWLAAQQKEDGHWELGTNVGFDKDHVVGTSFGVLPFLGAGVKPGSNHKYAKNVEKALDFLIAKQNHDGDWDDYSYTRALATMALCEAYGLQPREKYQKAAQKGVDYIVKAQCKDGSWGYKFPQDRGDTSNVGWQLQALYAAKVAGLKIPDEVWTKAGKYLDSVASSDGSGYGYAGNSHPTPRMTASALNGRFILGAKPAEKGVLSSFATLMNNLPKKTGLDYYYLLYAVQAARHVGGAEWQQNWNPKVRDLLVELQQPDGSWEPDLQPVFGRGVGRHGCTSVALLSLEVYYRYPIEK